MILDIIVITLMVGGILYHEEKKVHLPKIRTYHAQCGTNILYGYGTLTHLPYSLSESNINSEPMFIYIFYDNTWYATKFDTMADFQSYMGSHLTLTEDDLVNVLTQII